MRIPSASRTSRSTSSSVATPLRATTEPPSSTTNTNGLTSTPNARKPRRPVHPDGRERPRPAMVRASPRRLTADHREGRHCSPPRRPAGHHVVARATRRVGEHEEVPPARNAEATRPHPGGRDAPRGAAPPGETTAGLGDAPDASSASTRSRSSAIARTAPMSASPSHITATSNTHAAIQAGALMPHPPRATGDWRSSRAGRARVAVLPAPSRTG